MFYIKGWQLIICLVFGASHRKTAITGTNLNEWSSSDESNKLDTNSKLKFEKNRTVDDLWYAAACNKIRWILATIRCLGQYMQSASGVLVGLMQRDAAVDKIVDMSTANMYVYATLANMGVDKAWNRWQSGKRYGKRNTENIISS